MEENNYVELKKQGDDCFRAQDYEGAIEKYKTIIMVNTANLAFSLGVIGRSRNL
jgi:hypothetical protein